MIPALSSPQLTRMLGHDRLGVEHYLLALLDYGKSPIIECLFELNITPQNVRNQIDLLAPGSTTEQAERLAVTAGAGRLHELGLRESRQLGHSCVAPEHLLLAVIRQVDDPWAEPELAGAIFERLDVSPAALRQQLLSRMVFDEDDFTVRRRSARPNRRNWTSVTWPDLIPPD